MRGLDNRRHRNVTPIAMWAEITATVAEEFSDLPDASQWVRLMLRLGLALLLGAAIGWERERRRSAAGLRTHMLVALGTALFVLVPQQAGMNADQLSRIVQGLLGGIGFLGAGAVIKGSDGNQVRGLTTAAGLWATAAIGVAVGLGREATAVVSTALVLIILGALLRWERRMVPDEPGSADAADGSDADAADPLSSPPASRRRGS